MSHAILDTVTPGPVQNTQWIVGRPAKKAFKGGQDHLRERPGHIGGEKWIHSRGAMGLSV